MRESYASIVSHQNMNTKLKGSRLNPNWHLRPNPYNCDLRLQA